MIFIGLQFATPVSAAKMVDKGTITKYDLYTHKWYKCTWKTYQYRYKNGKINNNFIKIYRTDYVKNPKTNKYIADIYTTISIAKVSKSTLKITVLFKTDSDSDKIIEYEKTTLTASRYYWREFRDGLDI